MKNKITEVVDASFEVISSKASAISSSASDAGRSAIEAGRSAGKVVGKVAKTTAVLVGDLNGDGKVDIEDAKIAAERTKKAAGMIADESVKLGKEVMKSELVKNVAPYAAIGAAIAVPIPIIGPAIGAAIGAGLGLYKDATKKK
jgi:hypothetical protein